MAYKGNDLDLRPARPSAPAREAPGAAERAAAAAGARPASADPIPVDDAVLACCNCAYDVARFHGSEDVRLEHLLHALTRVGAAAELLAELEIRVDTLRRETAVAIAAEMPAGLVACGEPPTRPPSTVRRPACPTCSGPCWVVVPARPRLPC